jgi:hypothetical protein
VAPDNHAAEGPAREQRHLLSPQRAEHQGGLEHKITNDDGDSFRRWFLVANAKGRYSRGSSETLLDQDLLALRNGGGATELTQRLIQQVG